MAYFVNFCGVVLAMFMLATSADVIEDDRNVENLVDQMLERVKVLLEKTTDELTDDSPVADSSFRYTNHYIHMLPTHMQGDRGPARQHYTNVHVPAFRRNAFFYPRSNSARHRQRTINHEVRSSEDGVETVGDGCEGASSSIVYARCPHQGAKCPSLTRPKTGYMICVHAHWLSMVCPVGTIFNRLTKDCSTHSDYDLDHQYWYNNIDKESVNHRSNVDGDFNVYQTPVPVIVNTEEVEEEEHREGNDLSENDDRYVDYPRRKGLVFTEVFDDEGFLYDDPEVNVAAPDASGAATLDAGPAGAHVTSSWRDGLPKGLCEVGAFRSSVLGKMYFDECVIVGETTANWLTRQCSPGTEFTADPHSELPCDFQRNKWTLDEKRKSIHTHTHEQHISSSKENHAQETSDDETGTDSVGATETPAHQVIFTMPPITKPGLNILFTGKGTGMMTTAKPSDTIKVNTETPSTKSLDEDDVLIVSTTSTPVTSTTTGSKQASTTVHASLGGSNTQMTTSTDIDKNNGDESYGRSEKPTSHTKDSAPESGSMFAGFNKISRDDISHDPWQMESSRFEMPFMFDDDDFLVWPGRLATGGDRQDDDYMPKPYYKIEIPVPVVH